MDVAREAGVSRTTVSYVMNGRTDLAIPESTRERVLSVASQLGYRNHPIARALKTGRTNLIGLWLAPLDSSCGVLLQSAFYPLLRGDGYTPVVLDWGRNKEERASGLETLCHLPLVNAYGRWAERIGEGLPAAGSDWRGTGAYAAHRQRGN